MPFYSCMVAWVWAPFKALCTPPPPPRNGSIVVEYLVLLELPFSTQLEKEYEKVKVALKEELQNVSQDGNSCQNDQGEQKLGAWGWREGSGSQPPPQPAPAHTGTYGGQVSALWCLRQDRRRETGPQKTGSRASLRKGCQNLGAVEERVAQGLPGGRGPLAIQGT